jgi:hypothetical protein
MKVYIVSKNEWGDLTYYGSYLNFEDALKCKQFLEEGDSFNNYDVTTMTVQTKFDELKVIAE